MKNLTALDEKRLGRLATAWKIADRNPGAEEASILVSKIKKGSLVGNEAYNTALDIAQNCKGSRELLEDAAYTLGGNGNYERALPLFEALAEVTPGNDRKRFLSEALLQAIKSDDATKTNDIALIIKNLNGDAADIYAARAAMKLFKGKFDEALATLKDVNHEYGDHFMVMAVRKKILDTMNEHKARNRAKPSSSAAKAVQHTPTSTPHENSLPVMPAAIPA